MNWQASFESLYREMHAARRVNKGERAICKHGVMQHDEDGELLPCAFPDCAMGYPGHWLRRANYPAIPSFAAAVDRSPARSIVETTDYQRYQIMGLADHAPRLWLWVTHKQIEQENAAMRADRERAMAESRRYAAEREAAWAAMPWWRKATIVVRRAFARLLRRLSWRLEP